MENSYYSLEVNKSNKLTRLFQLIFGIVCALLAVTWIILNPDSFKWNTTLLPVLFLSSFSWYMINSGLGKAEKHIEISRDMLKIKRNSLFPAKIFNAPEIERIEVFPLSMVLHLGDGTRFLLRFGTTFTDLIDPVKRGIEEFCSLNNIQLEFRNEEI
jgi:hypothetical protein